MSNSSATDDSSTSGDNSDEDFPNAPRPEPRAPPEIESVEAEFRNIRDPKRIRVTVSYHPRRGGARLNTTVTFRVRDGVARFKTVDASHVYNSLSAVVAAEKELADHPDVDDIISLESQYEAAEEHIAKQIEHAEKAE